MQSIISWSTLWYLILALYIPASLGLIIVVLLQKGKGVGFAGAFGMGGGSDTVFGPRASKSLPQRLTYVMAGLFMALALVMSLIAGRLGTGVAPATVNESAEDYSALDDLGTAVQGGEGEGEPVPAAPGATTQPPAQPAPPAEQAAPTEQAPALAPAVETPAGPAAEPSAAAPQATVEKPTGEAGAPISPSVEAPKPAKSSPEQGTPPAVPVPSAPPAVPPAAPGAQ
ncbi:MAG: preprotein translocase subunit SecG [Candidatus Hydrogenedentes bacterium]|nr:preprotein translocase subunit SecG [Candidatus Hydrogenedentota bacterium]